MTSNLEESDVRLLTFLVSEEEENFRLDKFLAQRISRISRTGLQKLIETQNVTVGGETVEKSSFPVQIDQEVHLKIPNIPDETQLFPQEIPLDILYEDDCVIVLNKQANLVVHPAAGNFDNTLVNGLLYYSNQFEKMKINVRPGIVHRLDKDTTGAMIVAKTPHAHLRLTEQFAKREISKEYFAICFGHFEKKAGLIETKIAHHPTKRHRMAVTDEGKESLTEYYVLKEYPLFTSLRLLLHTGRTHQIRVHLSHIKHPILGDTTYGGRKPKFGGIEGIKSHFVNRLLKIMPNQALHSRQLGFHHPISNQWMEFIAPFPENIQNAINILEKSSENPVFQEDWWE